MEERRSTELVALYRTGFALQPMCFTPVFAELVLYCLELLNAAWGHKSASLVRLVLSCLLPLYTAVMALVRGPGGTTAYLWVGDTPAEVLSINLIFAELVLFESRGRYAPWVCCVLSCLVY